MFLIPNRNSTNMSKVAEIIFGSLRFAQTSICEIHVVLSVFPCKFLSLHQAFIFLHALLYGMFCRVYFSLKSWLHLADSFSM